MMSSLTYRNSSIELTKILAIFLIVVSHVAQTLSVNGYDVWHATLNVQNFVVSSMRYFGSIGNDIFFLCSAWFLLESKTVKWNKFLLLILDVWLVSVLICALVLFWGDRDIDRLTVFKQFFPISFANNWYITCYLVFYAIHPILNKSIESLDKSSLFRTSVGVIILFVLDSLLRFFRSSFLPLSPLVKWIGIYFVMAYLKLYLPVHNFSKRSCFFLFLFGFVGTFGSLAILNLSGNYIGFFSEKLQVMNDMENPFILMLTFGLVLLLTKFNWHNSVINYISSLSLFVYILHENDLIRTYYRTSLLQKICENFGYDHIVLLILLVSFAIFILAVIAGIVYKETLHKLLGRLVNRVYPTLKAVLS